MKVIVFEEEAYYKLLGELVKMVRDAINEKKQEKKWLDANETKLLLGIKSTSKLQQLRRGNQIKFSQHGRIIKYSTESINDFLERNIH